MNPPGVHGDAEAHGAVAQLAGPEPADYRPGTAISVDDLSDTPRPEGVAEPTVRLRHSLAARISALVLLVILASGASALLMLGQLRAFQASFDRLTQVYVVFNQRLAEAHVQAGRVYEQVRSHQARSEALGSERSDPAFSQLFALALARRNADIAKMREPIDDALRQPERFGGEALLEDLREIKSSVDELESLAAEEETTDPLQVLAGRQASQIDQLFKTLAAQSQRGIDELRAEVRAAQAQTERLMLGLTIATTLLGIIATLGVFFTLRPLRQLSASVRNLGHGDWEQRVRVTRRGRADEVTRLATEFNLMAAALEERERRLLRGERLAAAGQLAAQITHEIRNPLSSVALNAELLEDELEAATPEARTLLQKISREVDRLTAVTEDYLSFARRPKAQMMPLDLRDALENLLDFMQPELMLAGVQVQIELPPRPIFVRGDGGQLRQAFMNLIRNAQEAALEDAEPDRPAKLAVRVEARGERAVVVVEDNGPGIGLPPDQQDRIFEAFYTRKARGTGLGLPTVQQIIVDHGGTVSVAWTSDDGTAFEVNLPACAREDGSVSSEPASSPLAEPSLEQGLS